MSPHTRTPPMSSSSSSQLPLLSSTTTPLLHPDHHQSDVVVVGAGVFGCAIAYALASQGRSVVLLERWLREPDRIVGELLQPGGVATLKRLGLARCLDDIDAIPVRGYNCIYHGKPVTIPYPQVDDDGRVINEYGGPECRSATAISPQGRSFHHGRFITKLRDACLAHSNISVVEADVKGPIRGGGDLKSPFSTSSSPTTANEVLGVETLMPDAASGTKSRHYFFAPLTIACDGYMSIFRKQFLSAAAPQVWSKFYALELIDCELPVPQHGTVVIGDNSEVTLLYQIGTRETRMLIDVPLNCPAAAPAAGGVRGYIRNTVLPTLPVSLQPSVVAALDASDAIPRSMPNSYLPAQRQRIPGLAILGDALNMRHPLTGGGMTVGLSDAEIFAAELAAVPDLADRAAVARALDNMYARRKALTGNINVLAQALYSLFAANDWQLRVLQRGCFEYFFRQMADGPSGLMGGLIRRPAVLTWHFFTVAFVGIGMHLRELGWLMMPLGLVHAVMVLWTACLVFLPVMFTELW